MRISIFGLGYVGCVTAGCLSRDGHSVVGVDINADKVEQIRKGLCPIIEPGLSKLIADAVQGGRMYATTNTAEAIKDSSVSFVCVGTPSNELGALDLQYVRRVCAQIGESLRNKDHHHTIVLRSTMLPGSTEKVAIPILEEASRKRAGMDFSVCYNPEFLREGTAVRDFDEPPRTVIGQLDSASGDVLASIYAIVTGPHVRTDLRTAEMVKYSDNLFHALKVVFSNEIGNLCKAFQMDSHKVMDIFVLDTKLNLSAVYLKPGYAFGGSCLPKDVRALAFAAKELNVQSPLIRAVLESNERQKQLGYEMIRRTGRKKIGILGLSFKHDTDDLRESPAVELVETLIGKGYDVLVYDRSVSLSTLIGSNRAYIDRELPHLASLMRSTLDEVLTHAEVLVIVNREKEFAEAMCLLRPEQIVLDFVRICQDHSNLKARYEGICWQ
jgi:GDP-mannose 6-dehydrogenase